MDVYLLADSSAEPAAKCEIVVFGAGPLRGKVSNAARSIGSISVGLLLICSLMPAAVNALPAGREFGGRPGALETRQPGYLPTPFGLAAKQQVLVVPSGSRIEGESSVVLPNGTQVTIPAHNTTDPFPDNGWIAYADWTYSASGYSIGEFDAAWTLPSAPSSNDGQTIFLFNGLLPSSAGSLLIQPVLQWGVSACGGGAYWAMASWYVTSSGSYICSSLMSVSYSSISGQMNGYNCKSSNGQCDWVVQGTQFQNGNGYTTTLSYSSNSQLDNLALYWATVTLEAYNVAKCSDFPGGEVTFSDLFFASDVAPWQYPTPSWSTVVSDHDCYEAVTVNSPSSVTITF